MVLNKLQKRILTAVLVTILVSLTTGLVFINGGFKHLEWYFEDFKTVQVREGTKATEDVVVILVDESSLNSMSSIAGRWPWKRWVWSDVIEYLSAAGAQSIAFDILFTEQDLDINGQLNRHDQLLIESTGASGNTIHAFQILSDPENPYSDKPLPTLFPDKFSIAQVLGIGSSENDTFYLPAPELYSQSTYMGVVEFEPDSDGRYRRTTLFREYQGDFYPTLSMASLMSKLNINRVNNEADTRTLWVNDEPIPLDREGYYQVNLYETFESISFASVWASALKLRQGDVEALYTDERLVPPDFFEGKVVFIGASAVGTKDLKATPIDSRWPGVFLHASIVSNILDKDYIYQVKERWIYVLIASFAFITAFIVVFNGSLILQTVYPLFLLIGYTVVVFWAQYRLSLQIDFTPPVTAVALTWLIISGYLSATERKEKRRVRNMLAQYVSPAALNMVLEKYEDLAIAGIGKKEEMSVVFSDIRSFTNISEHLPPEQVVHLLNIHLEAMTQVTFEYGGTMDKFIGDATMAFWGAPIEDKQHALNATRAAIHMHRAMINVNEKLEREGMNPIDIGVGVNTGSVILGNIGSSQKLDYTIIGDAVNLGSRIEGLTKLYGVGVLISEFTQQKVYKDIPCALIDKVRVKGKQKPIKVFYPLGDSMSVNLTELFALVEKSERAFELYQARRFEEAITAFSALPDATFGTYKHVFIERCQACCQQPPSEDWDGVYNLTTK